MSKPKGPQNTLDFHTLLNSTCALELLASLALATTPSAVVSAQNSGRKTILAFLKRSLAEGGGGLGDADDVWLGTAVEVCLQKVVQMHDDRDDDRDDREELKEKEAAQKKLAVKEQIHQIKIEHEKEIEAQVPHQSSQLMTFKDPNILKPRPPFSNNLYNEISCSDLPCDVCGVNSVRYGCVRCECRIYCGEECYLKDKVEHYKECSIEDVKLSKAAGNRMKSIKSVDPIYHWDFRLKPVLDSPGSPTLCQYTNTPCNVMNKAHKTKDGLVCGPTFGYGEIDGLITVPRNFSIEVKLRFDIPQNKHYKPAKSDRYEVGTIFDFRSSSPESPNHSTPILFNTKPLFAESEEEDLEKSFGVFTPEVLEKAKSELNRDVEMTRLLTRRRYKKEWPVFATGHIMSDFAAMITWSTKLETNWIHFTIMSALEASGPYCKPVPDMPAMRRVTMWRDGGEDVNEQRHGFPGLEWEEPYGDNYVLDLNKIGADAFGDNWFQGTIQYVRIFDGILPEKEIVSSYKLAKHFRTMKAPREYDHCFDFRLRPGEDMQSDVKDEKSDLKANLVNGAIRLDEGMICDGGTIYGKKAAANKSPLQNTFLNGGFAELTPWEWGGATSIELYVKIENFNTNFTHLFMFQKQTEQSTQTQDLLQMTVDATEKYDPRVAFAIDRGKECPPPHWRFCRELDHSAPQNANWAHYVCTVSKAGTMSIFKNGYICAISDEGHSPNVCTRNRNVIGGMANGRKENGTICYMKGVYAYIRFWHGTELNEKEVSYLYRSRNSRGENLGLQKKTI